MNNPIIAIVGIGGAGQNIINYLKSSGITDYDSVKYMAVNCDWESLKQCRADILLPIGTKPLDGLSAHGDAGLGRDCAIESRESIKAALADSHLVFIIAGLGGGTGTGAAPEIARISRGMDMPCLAAVTLPFAFEGEQRLNTALSGLTELNRVADAVIAVSNNWMRFVVSPKETMENAFNQIDRTIGWQINHLIKRRHVWGR